MIRLFLHVQWEHQPIHLHGVCVREVANDLRHLLSAKKCSLKYQVSCVGGPTQKIPGSAKN